MLAGPVNATIQLLLMEGPNVQGTNSKAKRKHAVQKSNVNVQIHMQQHATINVIVNTGKVKVSVKRTVG